jgi:glycerophosphoryl diester phosphodiesterase
MSPHHQIIDRKSVTAMQDEGLAVIPWTANSKRQWARLLKLGVDGIITDDPKALMEYLER